MFLLKYFLGLFSFVFVFYCGVHAANKEHADSPLTKINVSKSKRQASVLLQTVCEHSTLRLRCSQPNTVIRVASAVYGRQNRRTCIHPSMRTTNCASSSSLSVVRNRCEGKQSCAVSASNSVFGDPCVGTFKYLTVSYQCVPRGKSRVMCEHATLYLACANPEEVLSITSAMYGRKDRHTCPHRYIRTTSCESSRSLSVVSKLCDGRRVCHVSASNRVFGDPCEGTYKYLAVTYQCVSSSAGAKRSLEEEGFVSVDKRRANSFLTGNKEKRAWEQQELDFWT